MYDDVFTNWILTRKMNHIEKIVYVDLGTVYVHARLIVQFNVN